MKSNKFKDLVSKNPNNELFRFSLGQALAEEGDHHGAIKAFDFCLAKKSDWMMAAILKGKSLAALNLYDEAKPVFENALEMAVGQDHEGPEAELRKLLASIHS